MKNIVILTGNELRHQFFRKKIALTDGINVLRSYCETEENLIAKSAKQSTAAKREQHLLARAQSEKDFFDVFVNTVTDFSNPHIINRGTLNNDIIVKDIKTINPDLVIVYGASILKAELLAAFPDRIINVHLGLSPYYRGSGTNFWPLVDGYPELVGATYMYIDAGIDTGKIIHQLRATYNYFDTPVLVGNRLIKDMTEVFGKLIVQFDTLQESENPTYNNFKKFCKKGDFSEESVDQVYTNFKKGMVDIYLNNLHERNNTFPLVVNNLINN